MYGFIVMIVMFSFFGLYNLFSKKKQKNQMELKRIASSTGHAEDEIMTLEKYYVIMKAMETGKAVSGHFNDDGEFVTRVHEDSEGNYE